MNQNLDPSTPADAAFPNRIPVSREAIAAYVADSIAVKQQLLADAATRRQAEVSAIRGAPILAYSRGGEGAAGPAMPAILAAQGGPSREATELDQLRRGSSIGQARAARLPDRNFLIVAGANIPCILQTAMDTTTPGYVSCLIPRDVLSDNGAVVLMEKGTKVLGEYRSSLRQGQRLARAGFDQGGEADRDEQPGVLDVEGRGGGVHLQPRLVARTLGDCALCRQPLGA